MQGTNLKLTAIIVVVGILAIIYGSFALILFSIPFLIASPFAIFDGLVVAIKHFKKSKILPLIFLLSVSTLIIGVYMAITSPIRHPAEPATQYMLVFLAEVFSYFAAVISFAVMRHSQGKEGFAKHVILFSLSLGAVLFWSAFFLSATGIAG